MQVLELAPWWAVVMIMFVAAYFLVNGLVRYVPALTILGGLLFVLSGFLLSAAGEPAVTDMIFYTLNIPAATVLIMIGSVMMFTGVIQMVSD